MSGFRRTVPRLTYDWLGRDCLQHVVARAHQPPAALMHQPVMPAAEKDQVPELVRTSVRPVLDVMRICPRRRHVAALEATDSPCPEPPAPFASAPAPPAGYLAPRHRPPR